jgi:WhiB family transcriptional regulator, redox-sensing transcriptional regulator
MQNGSGNGQEPPRLLGWGPIQPWEADANCKDAPLELFFGREPEDGGPRKHTSRRTKAQQAQAKALCDSCPVLVECRTWAIESGIPYGYLAGMTEGQRVQERLRRGLPPQTQRAGVRVERPERQRKREPSAKIQQGSIRTALGTTTIKVEHWPFFQGQNG